MGEVWKNFSLNILDWFYPGNLEFKPTRISEVSGQDTCPPRNLGSKSYIIYLSASFSCPTYWLPTLFFLPTYLYPSLPLAATRLLWLLLGCLTLLVLKKASWESSASWVNGGKKEKILFLPLIPVPVLVPAERDFPTLGLPRNC